MRLIDADSLLLRMEKRADCEPVGHFRTIKRMMKMVAEQPTVDTAKHGKWVAVNPDERGFADIFACSCCEKRVYLAFYDRECDYDFCPRCCAKMYEEAD